MEKLVNYESNRGRELDDELEIEDLQNKAAHEKINEVEKVNSKP
jgi:hypothetical protein